MLFRPRRRQIPLFLVFVVLQMAPRKSSRVRGPSQKVQESQLQALQRSSHVAAAGLLALNAGIRRSQPRLQSIQRRRRRGSSTTASNSAEEDANRGGEDNGMDLGSDSQDSQEESNTRYRRQRGLADAGSHLPDSQPPSAQPTRPTPESDFDSDPEPLPLNALKHFEFMSRSMIKNKIVGGDTLYTKDWSYQTYLVRECEKLQAVVERRPGHSIEPPRFASEMKIAAKGLNPAISVPLRNNADLESILRAWYRVKYRLKKESPYAILTIPFEHVVTIEPTPPTGTPNTSHSLRRTATIRQRETAAANAAIAEIVGDFRTQISRKHACPDALCRNHPRPCVITAQFGHLPMGTRLIRD